MAAPIPEALELCTRCLRGVVFYRGRAVGIEGAPYCPVCGGEKPGIRFARVPEERGRQP
jgi:hypothetical protein